MPAAAATAAGDEDGRWAKIWGEVPPGGRPPFDAGASPRALVDLLASPAAPPVQGARVLIPGAGRGYDAATLVRAGAASAVALDIVPAAVDAATSWLAGQTDLPPGAATAACGDFFNLPPSLTPAASPFFDGGFDYTFFCALPPAWRAAWGVAWGRAIRRGGWLVTLQFPVAPPDDLNRPGPPWPVTAEAYEGALLPAGFALVRRAVVPPGHSFRSEDGSHDRNGREWVAVWEKKGVDT